jgi:hypothetical protein
MSERQRTKILFDAGSDARVGAKSHTAFAI